MFKEMLNFRKINWWTLLGGLGLNFIITMLASTAGAYLASQEATRDAYQRHGPLLMMLGIFLVCGLAGFVIAKIADDVPIKHAFLSSLGAFVPLLVMGVLTLAPMSLMFAVIAAAGNLNGGMLAVRRRHYHYDPHRDDG